MSPVSGTDGEGGWRQRLPAPPWALITVAALLSVVVLSYSDLAWWALAGALLAPITATAFLATRPLISLSVCVPVALATALAMRNDVPPWTAALAAALAVISLLAGRRMSHSAPALTVFAVGVVAALPLTLIAEEGWATGLLMLALAVALPWGLGRSIRQQAELASATAERAHLRERTRISHDMHDTLGHELSLVALRAGALELAPDLDERHRAAARELRAAAGAATERLAHIVAVLRDGEPAPLAPVADDIEDLVDRAGRAGLPVTLAWTGSRELELTVDRAAHRVVQEALTNAVKHAPGAAVQVRVTVTDATTVVAVTNALSPRARQGTGSRLGLEALRERVRLAGGTLHAGPRADTYEIEATLPNTREP